MRSEWNCCNLCDKYKIPYSIDHIFGIPTEGEQEQKQSAEFYAKINP